MFLIIAIVVAAALCAMLGVNGLRFLGNLIVLVVCGAVMWVGLYGLYHPAPGYHPPAIPAWLDGTRR